MNIKMLSLCVWLLSSLSCSGFDLYETADLWKAAQSGDLRAIEAIVKSKVLNLNTGNTMGNAALHYAAFEGHEAVVEELLKGGANPNLTNEAGQTPLMSASFKSHELVIEALLKHGADRNKVDALGKKALDYAQEHGRQELINLLIEH